MSSKFHQKVFQVTKKIPRGKVMTYKEVARAIGASSAARAVGNALNKNCDQNISCHRVVMSDGFVGGYNKGTERKILRLKKEGIEVKNGRIINLKRFLISL